MATKSATGSTKRTPRKPDTRDDAATAPASTVDGAVAPSPTDARKPQGALNGETANSGDTQADPTTPDARAEGAPMIVGIGASAGGLEAFKNFFAHMPADCDMAFVLVQHLAPDHHSLLAELVGRSTSMMVLEAVDGEAVQPSHVYVIPPDATLTIADGALQITRPAPPRQHRWPIDTFFMSLAQDQGDAAVCIVLSGNGSDGARGLRAIKENGGLTLAQAGFDHTAMTGMPASAASTGLVDDILPVEAMPARLLAHQRQLRDTRGTPDSDGMPENMPTHLQTLCGILRNKVGHDFSGYKDKTLMRRIQRRMQVTQNASIADYIALLRRDPDECDLLFQELLINVTEFFRDEGAFEALRKQAILPLLAVKGADDDVRVWVAGCATGEEAYSIAMLLKEALGDARQAPKIMIFATDIDHRTIDAARAGRYRAPLAGVSPERAERWFTRDGDNYTVIKSIREMCVFSPHSVIKDPPFSRLDLVSCRNLLIYLNADVQQRLVRTFHYALRPGGFLLLGSSEGIAHNARLFTVLDKKQRLFARRNDVSAGVPELTHGTSKMPAAPRAPVPAETAVTDDPLGRRARRVLDKYSPAYVVIDANHDIQRFGGEAGRYLGPSSGAASLNLFALLHRGLRTATRTVVGRALAANAMASEDDVTVTLDGASRNLRVIAEPLPETSDGGALYAVLFVEHESAEPAAATSGNGGDEPIRARALERELESMRAQLQAAFAKQETAQEEMKSANEEYQSVNEELQSANEELETSKEEMQSINEELQTVNAELQSKNAALVRLNSDLYNLLESTQIATLFLGPDLHIRTFTPAVAELFHLREADRGRPITEISARVQYPELRQDVIQVLRTLTMIERTVSGDDGDRAFQLRMRPYRTVDNVIDGVVLTFVDISERQQHEIERGRLSAIVDASMDAIIGFSLEGLITSWNAGAEHMLGYPAAQMIGAPLAKLFADHNQARAQAVIAVARKGVAVQEQIRQWRRHDGGTLEVVKMISPVRDSQGRSVAGSIIARDNRERRDAGIHRDLMLDELNHRVKNSLATIQAIAQQTLAHSTTLEQFRETFMARLLALSNTHNLLARDTWAGTGVREIVAGELAPYQRGDNKRADLSGDAVRLNPKTALALSMALHELATNAAKYGALSVAQGRVSVHWETRDRHGAPWLQLRWIERGGPAVITPTRRGFGTRLIGEGLTFELDGEVNLQFEATGVVCDIAIPLPRPDGELRNADDALRKADDASRKTDDQLG